MSREPTVGDFLEGYRSALEEKIRAKNLAVLRIGKLMVLDHVNERFFKKERPKFFPHPKAYHALGFHATEDMYKDNTLPSLVSATCWCGEYMTVTHLGVGVTQAEEPYVQGILVCSRHFSHGNDGEDWGWDEVRDSFPQAQQHDWRTVVAFISDADLDRDAEIIASVIAPVTGA